MGIAKLLAIVVSAALLAACAQPRPVVPHWIVFQPRADGQQADDGDRRSRAVDGAASAAGVAGGALVRNENKLSCPPWPVGAAPRGTPTSSVICPACPSCRSCPPQLDCGARVGDREAAKCPSIDVAQLVNDEQLRCDARLQAEKAKSQSIQLKFWPAVEYAGDVDKSWLLLSIPTAAVVVILVVAGLLLWLAYWARGVLYKVWEESKVFPEVQAQFARAVAVFISLGLWVPAVTLALLVVAAAIFLNGSGARPEAIAPPAQLAYVAPSASAVDRSRPDADLASARADAERLRQQLAASQGELAGLRAAWAAGGRVEGFWTPFFLGGIVGALVASIAVLALCNAWRHGRAERKDRRGRGLLVKDVVDPEPIKAPANLDLLAKRADLWLDEIRFAYDRLHRLLANPPRPGAEAPALPLADGNAKSVPTHPKKWLEDLRGEAIALRRAIQEVIAYPNLEAAEAAPPR